MARTYWSRNMVCNAKKKQMNRLLIGLNGLKGRVCRRKIGFILQKETEKSGFIFTEETAARIITFIL